MSLFVAAYPPAGVSAHLGEAVASLAVGRALADGINTRLARPDTWHITVAFLGEVADSRVDDVILALRQGVVAWLPQPPPCLRLAGGGRFGRGRFTLLWAGVEGDISSLAELGSTVRRALRRARVRYDHRPLRPHVTIARPGDRVPARDIAADLAALRAYQGPEWTVVELKLMQSHPGPSPTYDELAAIPLR